MKVPPRNLLLLLLEKAYVDSSDILALQQNTYKLLLLTPEVSVEGHNGEAQIPVLITLQRTIHTGFPKRLTERYSIALKHDLGSI